MEVPPGAYQATEWHAALSVAVARGRVRAANPRGGSTVGRSH
eukprot:CAMPEP_0204309368 /NCGR_PEP_ID=MMETSP0469-20131031/1058_1 /ASSEMBLY_ACC=CAM_ASM_000384 /TAXON_ID=2969 /ORGANISM="Oxyrrhis marina" /LENGTH=41 /DNA_ID= /DNA_START= /DNA_END= /DNA_ORIENTATION=